MTAYKKYHINFGKTGAKRERVPKFYDEMNKFVKYSPTKGVQSFGLDNYASPGPSGEDISFDGDSDTLSGNFEESASPKNQGMLND